MVYVEWPKIFSLPLKFIHLLIKYNKFEDEKSDINMQKLLNLYAVFLMQLTFSSIDGTALSQTLKLACNAS